MQRTGIANLPLHYGVCPPWLFEKMTKLARAITEIIVYEYSPEEFLKRLADPFFFQSFGCVLGFDFHSSGLTTTVTAALKEGLGDLQNDLGIFICGGKGKTSRKTPDEIIQIANRYSLNALCLVYASKMSAKVDNSALQDGYQLYHHVFIFTPKNQWTVIQQGMNDRFSFARRYHWLNTEGKLDYVCEPHSGIATQKKEQKVLNMVAKGSDKTRKISTKVSCEKPEKVIKQLKKIQELSLPKEHEVREIKPENLKKIFLKTYEKKPEDFEKLLSLPGVGPKTIRALSLISELIYGAKPSYDDPAKYSWAHGGKDGYPYPVDKTNYDKSIEILKTAINKAKIGDREKLQAFHRLGGYWRLNDSYLHYL